MINPFLICKYFSVCVCVCVCARARVCVPLFQIASSLLEKKCFQYGEVLKQLIIKCFSPLNASILTVKGSVKLFATF